MNDYVYFYESQGYAFLLEDMIVNYYLSWPAVIIGKENIIRVYVPSFIPLALQEKGFAISRDDLEKSASMIRESIGNIKNISLAESISPADLHGILKLFQVILQKYSLFDVSYSEGIYQKNPNDPRSIFIEKTKNVIRDDFDWLFFREDGFLEALVMKIAQQTGQSADLVRWYRIPELLSLLEKKSVVAHQEIEARKKEYLFDRGEDGSIQFFSGTVAQSKISDFLKKIEKSSDSVIKGTVAHGKGKTVRGRAYLIHRDYSDYDKFLKDMTQMPDTAVLVTTITDPEFIPAMNRALAIVTDIGGLLSHAAITAREFDKICIVGTRNATKILKTGDTVEVDADSGIVTILS